MVGSESSNGDDVIDLTLDLFSPDATFILQNRVGVDTAGNGTASVNLSHKFLFASDFSVLSDRGVGEDINLGAEATLFTEGITGFADVDGLAGVVVAGALAVTFGGLCAACFVNLAGFIRNVTRLLDEFIDTSVGTTVATTGNLGGTVENVLDGQVDVGSYSTASDLDTIGKRGEGTVSPTTSTVLRDVLIKSSGDQTGWGSGSVAEDCRPVPVDRDNIGGEIFMRLGKSERVLQGMSRHNLVFAAATSCRG